GRRTGADARCRPVGIPRPRPGAYPFGGDVLGRLPAAGQDRRRAGPARPRRLLARSRRPQWPCVPRAGMESEAEQLRLELRRRGSRCLPAAAAGDRLRRRRRSALPRHAGGDRPRTQARQPPDALCRAGRFRQAAYRLHHLHLLVCRCAGCRRPPRGGAGNFRNAAGRAQPSRPAVGGCRPEDRRIVGQLPPDLFHGRPHRLRDAAVQKLGGILLARLVIVSNRVSMPRERLSRAGGLAVALREALNQYGGLWFGWSGEITETPSSAPRRASAGKCEFAVHDLTPDEHHRFYVDFANSTLWPLCHYRLGLIDFHRAAFEGYYAVNERFAASLAEMLRPDDIVWVHDYHFIPMAAALRRRGVENRIGFFLHIPFPAPEARPALPGHARLVRALCAYDLIGLQPKGAVRALTEYSIQDANGDVSGDGVIHRDGRHARVAAFPIGIETQGFAKLAAAE